MSTTWQLPLSFFLTFEIRWLLPVQHVDQTTPVSGQTQLVIYPSRLCSGIISPLPFLHVAVSWLSVSVGGGHIDLCAIEYSLGDALTALKHGGEACLHIWHLMIPLHLPTFHVNCWLIKRNCWQNILQQYDFWQSELHEKILTLLGKILFKFII